jgi:hypothetical protein
MNRAGYEQLVAENIEWLLGQPRTLEREHIIEIVRASVAHEYPSTRTCGCQVIVCDECLIESAEYARRHGP